LSKNPAGWWDFFCLGFLYALSGFGALNPDYLVEFRSQVSSVFSGHFFQDIKKPDNFLSGFS
jgi:hypothetical protein